MKINETAKPKSSILSTVYMLQSCTLHPTLYKTILVLTTKQRPRQFSIYAVLSPTNLRHANITDYNRRQMFTYHDLTTRTSSYACETCKRELRHLVNESQTAEEQKAQRVSKAVPSVDRQRIRSDAALKRKKINCRLIITSNSYTTH